MEHLDRVIRLGWDSYLGQTDTLESLTMLGRYPVKTQDILHDAVSAMEQALIHTGYENPCDWIGSYYKRPITGTDWWSTHSYGIAIDLDYGGGDDADFIDHNPHLHRPIQESDFGNTIQLLKHQVTAILNIKNLDGRQVWRWLGYSIGDSMHFEINVAPNATQIDWATVTPPLPEPEDDMTFEQFAADEFDLWSDTNIMEAWDAGMFEDTNREGFHDWWVVDRDDRDPDEKARFITDYRAHLWRRT